MAGNVPTDIKFLIESVLNVTTGMRFTAFSDIEELRAVWTDIRTKEAVMDMVIEGTAEFCAYYITTAGVWSGSEEDNIWDELLRVIARSLAMPRNATRPELAIADIDFLQRSFDEEEWFAILSNNTWFLYLYLIRLASLTVEDLYRAVMPNRRGNAA